MSFEPKKPYNDLPLLPPKANLETPAILKRAISANKALEQIGILESKKVGKETLYLNRALYDIFTRQKTCR